MIHPDLHRLLTALPDEDLRQVIAHAAGIHAHRDGDGGKQMAEALRRIADRLTGAPRTASPGPAHQADIYNLGAWAQR
jgi:hypothetical protein